MISSYKIRASMTVFAPKIIEMVYYLAMHMLQMDEYLQLSIVSNLTAKYNAQAYIMVFNR